MLINVSVSSKEFQACHGVSPSGPCGVALELTAMDTIFAPLPPPPPPLPPPPPPPPPSVGLTHLNSSRRSKLRNLNWERIPKERVEGRPSVWSGPTTAEDDFAIDLRSLDELFSQREVPPIQKAGSFRQSQRRCRSAQGGADKVSLLDAKRSMNVGIFLRQFKSAAREIVEDIKQGAGERYGAEKLSELCKLLPDREEEKRLRSFQGDRGLLEEPDLFMLLLVDLPSFRLRLDAMILKQEFDPSVTSLCVAARTLGEAARELRSCSELHVILRLVLKAGNYMNAGSYAGNAAGFRIASLLKLADTKANKPGMNLLHFVAMEVVKKDQGLLLFPSQLEHIAEASRLSEESLQDDLSRLRDRLSELKASIQTVPEVQQQTQEFLEAAEKKLQEAEAEMEALQIDSQALADFFCEEESAFKLEEACRVFHCFCQRFQKAVKENAERELKEQRQAERENMEKRRSVALCTGLEPDRGEDSLEQALEKTLITAQSRRSLRQSRSLRFWSSPNASLRRLSADESCRQQELSVEATQTHGPGHPGGMNAVNTETQHGLNTISAVSDQRLICDATDSQHGLSIDTLCGQYGPKSGTLDSQSGLSTDPKCSTGQLDTQESTHNINSQQGPITDATHSAQEVYSLKQNKTPAESPDSRCRGWRQSPQLAECPLKSSVLPNGLQVKAAETVTQGVNEPSSDSAQLLRLVSERVLAQQLGSASASVAEMNKRRGSNAPGQAPQLALEAEHLASGKERTYLRVGETLECLTLVRGLHSYENLTAPVQRTPPSHCSKWRKEREVGDREGAGSRPGKDDTQSGKDLQRGARKNQVPRLGISIGASLSKVHTKADQAPAEEASPAHVSRLPITRSHSGRTTVGLRPSNAQPQIRRVSSNGEKGQVTADQTVKANRNLQENGRQEKDKTPAPQAPFVRGSPMRISKRLAPKTESHIPSQGRTVLSPSSTTPKTIRTSIIAAAAAKEAKTSESASTRALGSRLAGPKVARPAPQPMWR